MASIIEGYEYDIFISYRHKDNKYDNWVTQFVDNLRKELEATFKEDLSIYFDENPHDGLLEMHSVNKSLEEKLKCLVFIPVISQTYCDPKSFAWQNEFCAFNKLAKEDQFGRDIRLPGGNVSSRILPVKINDLDPEDKDLLENELGGVLRAIEFTYKEPGVNRPLTPDDDEKKNLNKTKYRNQINKVANAVKEITKGLKYSGEKTQTEGTKVAETEIGRRKIPWLKMTVAAAILIVILIAGLLILPPVIKKLSGASSAIAKSIAVLPFKLLSNEPDKQYIADAMMEQILLHLSKFRDLRVLGSTSTEQYRQTSKTIQIIGKELSVDYILEGSFQKYGDNVRLIVQLIRTKKESYIWANEYNRNWNEIFAVQSEVAQAVARELKAVITPEVKQLIEKIPTTELAAYDAYLKGQFYWRKLTQNDLQTAMRYFDLAKKIDPEYALAYAGICDVWMGLQQMGIVSPAEAVPKAEAAIMKALELDSTRAEVMYSLALMKTWGKWDWKGGESAFKKAIAINPNFSVALAYYSHLLNILGRSKEAMRQIETALSLDPINPLIKSAFGMDLLFERRYDDAILAFQDALNIDPTQRIAINNLPTTLHLVGRDIEALEAYKSQFKNSEIVEAYNVGYTKAGFSKAIRQVADLLEELSKTTYIRQTDIAYKYALSGDKDKAIQWLENGFQQHDPNLPYLLLPEYDSLRDDSRFQDLCRRMNLPYK